MKTVLLLLKKDRQIFLSENFNGNRRHDVFGALSTIILLALLYGTFIYVFYHFARFYMSATFEVQGAERARAFELTTFVYAAMLLINIFVGVKQIYSALVSSNDCDVLIYQPISQQHLFLYKLIKIYIGQIVSTLLVLLPSAIVIDVLSASVGGFWYYLTVVFHLLLCPLLGCAIAALFTVPFNGIMRFVQRKFVLHLILYVIVLALGFWLYGMFLSVLTDLIQTGELLYVLDSSTVNAVAAVAAKFYPVKFFSNMLFGQNVAVSLLSVLGICAVAGVVTYFVIRAMYFKVLQQKLEGDIKIFRKKKSVAKIHSPLAALVKKEFLIILRTPTYAFAYFATTFTLPFMVYVCANLMRSMVATLPNVALINCDFEIAIFVIAMFSVLTNTFCTSNISRDGKMFSMLKTMPVDGYLVVKAKLLFCSVVSVASVLVSCIVLLCVSYLNWWQALVIFAVASLLDIAEIAFATKRDLAKPHLPQNDRDEVTEDNNNVSAVTLLGLVCAVFLGGGALAMSLILSLLYTNTLALTVTMTFVFIAVILVFILSLVYLFRDLEDNFYKAED